MSDEKRDHVLRVGLSADEQRLIVTTAEGAQQLLHEWCREVLLSAARAAGDQRNEEGPANG